MSEQKTGHEEGDVCGRGNCTGIIEVAPVENCSCHINPPCGQCTEIREFCATCDWRGKDDDLNDYKETLVAGFSGGPYLYTREPKIERPLDPTKIDYRIKMHTNSSQICEGVYPEGTSSKEVEARVRGTFGGRFESFGDGRFKYVAYTD